MTIDYSERAGKSLDGLADTVRKAFFKQVKFLEENLRHPSLRAKKYDASQDIWQARVNKDWRFYFLILDDVYYIVDITLTPNNMASAQAQERHAEAEGTRAAECRCETGIAVRG
jgi:mRNA interferase RelE/StbE